MNKGSQCFAGKFVLRDEVRTLPTEAGKVLGETQRRVMDHC
jgi:hypothetical protein